MQYLGERMSKLEIQQIHKSFIGNDGLPLDVIDNFSLDVEEKESIVILGPSGCGKSTLLKILGGVLPASSGNLKLDSVDYGVEIPRSELRRFGFVFQQNNLLQWRSVEGNLKFMLDVMKLKGQEWTNRIDEILEIVGLKEFKTIFPHELSGGMKQRVGIARSLVHDPEILILDQPFGALDAITRTMISFELLSIWKQTQKTIIMVTNNVNEAVLLANKVLIFSPLPAKVVATVDIDIPLEERGPKITESPRFLELSSHIGSVIRSVMEEVKDEN
jgi:NitT/TauT family transport system ATP-binding protein